VTRNSVFCGSHHPVFLFFLTFTSTTRILSVDKCFVPTDVLYDRARDRNVKPGQLVEHGLPIRKGFWSTESVDPVEKRGLIPKVFRGKGIGRESGTSNKETLRQELGLDLELPTVLLVGGGDGMGGIVEISKSVGNKLGSGSSRPAYQMVVVCGSNKAAQETLSSVDWGTGVKVKVQGFVNNMDEWMKASDVLVTKAGPGTIAEASICGLPCMLFNYL
jgi:1,2-diacylglycerol 3-beta-galactosyltransferase